MKRETLRVLIEIIGIVGSLVTIYLGYGINGLSGTSAIIILYLIGRLLWLKNRQAKVLKILQRELPDPVKFLTEFFLSTYRNQGRGSLADLNKGLYIEHCG